MFRGIIAFIFVAFSGHVFATDPTRPLSMGSSSTKATQNKALQLQSIIASEDSLRVVISGKTLAVGDSISGYTLIAIEDNDVTLKSLEKTVTLSLFKRVISKNN